MLFLQAQWLWKCSYFADSIKLFVVSFGFVEQFQNSMFCRPFLPLQGWMLCKCHWQHWSSGMRLQMGWESWCMCYVLLKEKMSLFTTRILPFYPVTASKCSGPTTLLTPDQTTRAEHCWAALRGRDCTASARFSLTGTQLGSVGQIYPSSKGFQLWRLTKHIWRLVEEVRTSCTQSTGWKMAVWQPWLCACQSYRA